MTDIEQLTNRAEALERKTSIEWLTNRVEALERNVKALERPVRKLRLAMFWVLPPAVVLGVWKAAAVLWGWKAVAEYDWSGWLGAVGVVVTYGVLFVWLLKEPGKGWLD